MQTFSMVNIMPNVSYYPSLSGYSQNTASTIPTGFQKTNNVLQNQAITKIAMPTAGIQPNIPRDTILTIKSALLRDTILSIKSAFYL